MPKHSLSRRSPARLRISVGAFAATLIVGIAAQQQVAFAATPPANDNFASATNLGQVSEYYGFGGAILAYASAQAGEPKHAGDPAAPIHSVWYQWTAPFDSAVALSVWVGFETHDCMCAVPSDLAVYTGSTLTGLTTIANDYEPQWDSGTSVQFQARRGVTYKIAVDSAKPVYGNSSPSINRVHGSIVAELDRSSCTVTPESSGGNALVGTPGNDVICGDDADFQTLKGLGGNDVLYGGGGEDWVLYENAPTGVKVSLLTGVATGEGTDSLVGIERVDGSPYADTLNGGNGPDVLVGWDGNDAIHGQGGADQLWGESGNDEIAGGTGLDILDGGAGVDTATFVNSSTAVSADLTSFTASVDYGTEPLQFFENVTGTPYNDSISGTRGPNKFYGQGGNDVLDGRDGNDKLYGQAGADALTGGLGTDLCDGGPGTDSAGGCETKVAIP